MDDIDDDEGDEEAALKARLEQQAREEKQQTKAIITAITEGHDAAKRLLANKNTLTFEDLIADDDEAISKMRQEESQMQEGNEDADEFDEEEMLMKGLQSRKDREQKQLLYRSEFDDMDDEEAEEVDLAEEMAMEELAKMSEEERKKEEEQIQRRREKLKEDYLKRKQFEEYTRMKRALRRATQESNFTNSQISSSMSNPFSIDNTNQVENSQTMGASLDNKAKENNLVKRRTSLVPKHYDGKPSRHLSNPPAQIQRSNTTLPTVTNPLKRGTSVYKGTIDVAELAGGYGMGMATTQARKNNSTTTGLFSAVMNGQTNVSAKDDKLKRSFSALSRKKSFNSSTGVNIASQQFVFLGEDMTSQSAANTMMSSKTNLQRNISTDQSSSRSLSRGNSSASTLFDKLGNRSNLLKRSATIMSSAN